MADAGATRQGWPGSTRCEESFGSVGCHHAIVLSRLGQFGEKNRCNVLIELHSQIISCSKNTLKLVSIHIVIGSKASSKRLAGYWCPGCSGPGTTDAPTLAAVVVVGSVVHALLIEGTMGLVSKAALCALVLAAKVMADLRAWTLLTRRRALRATSGLVMRQRLGRKCRVVPGRRYGQLSTRSPPIRSNSRRLLVTRMSPRLRAWAPISMS